MRGQRTVRVRSEYSMTVLLTWSARATNTANILHINIGENILTRG